MTLPPLLLSLEPTAEMGPNDDNIIWAPGKFFFYVLHLFNLYFSFLIGLIYNNETTPRQQQWPLTGPWKHPQPLLQVTAHGVGTCATNQQENSNTTGRLLQLFIVSGQFVSFIPHAH
jgi:hypothetical protein